MNDLFQVSEFVSLSVNWFFVSCYVFLVSCFCSGLKVQTLMLFYVSSFMFLVLFKNSAFNAVLCFKFRVSGFAPKFGLQCCFMFQFFVFYVSCFMFLLQKRHDKK